MKRALIIVPATLVVLVLIALVAPGFVDWNKYKPEAIAQIRKSTGYDVALNGNLGLSLLPAPHIYIESVQIAAPQGSAENYLARAKRLDVNLAIGPLLTGKVDFSSVKLVEPEIALQVFDDGTQNWMTPELQAMTRKDSTQAVPNTPQKQTAIALRDVSIDKGKFVYRAGKGAAPAEVTDVNIDMSADTLHGPFDVDGSLTTGGQTIQISAKTGTIDQAANAIKANVNAAIKPLDARVKFAGVVGLSEPYDMQGETEIEVSSLKDKLKNAPVNIDGDSVSLKGLLTGNRNAASFKDAVLNAGGNEFRGDLAAQMSPVKVTGRLIAAKPVNLDTIIKPGQASESKNSSSSILPPTVELPAAFEADLALSAPGLTLKGQSYKDVTIAFAKTGSTITAGFAAGEIPGKGSIDAKADVKFASKSVSKTGSEIFSDPTVTGTIKGQTQNIAQTAEALTGARNPALDSFKTASLDGGFSIAPDVLQLKSSTLRLGEMNMTVAAAYSPRGTRPAIALDLSADTLNFDEIQKKMGAEPKQQGNLEDTLKSLAIPYDVDFDIGVQNATLNGQKITGLRAQGTSRQNALKFTNLSAQNFAGSSFKLEGGIGNLKELKAIDVKFQGESSDVKGVAKMAGLDPATLPAQIDKASVNATLAGDISKLAVKATVAALNGQVIASGDVADPLTQLKISNMAVQIKHRSMAEALRLFSPSAPQYASWNKPLDLYTEIETSGKTHNFRNIKGDLAGASLTGTFSYDASGAKPMLKGDLTFGDLVMVSDAASAAAVSKSANAAPASARQSGRWSSEPIDAAWMNAFDADLSIKAKSITYETWAFSQPSLSITLQNGALQIKDMKSGIYGGQMAMSGVLKSNAGKAPVSIDGNAKFDNVQIEQLAASLARGTRLIKGSGAVSMDTAIKGTGSSQQALISSLSGNGTMTGKTIVLEGFDLARFGKAMSDENKPAETLTGLWKTTIKGGSTQFDTLDGNYTISQGVVTINKLDMKGPTANMATTGNVNLPAWTLATNHEISMPKYPDIPPFTIKFAGSLDNPGQTFGQGLIQDYLQRKLDKKLQSVISDKIGGKAGGALGTLLGLPQQPQPTEQQPAAGDESAPAEQTAPAQDGSPEAQPVQQEQQPAQEQQDPAAEALQGVLQNLLKKK